jgi:hypothetical protein
LCLKKQKYKLNNKILATISRQKKETKKLKKSSFCAKKGGGELTLMLA